MKKTYYIFALHIVLLVLASTNFSIVGCIRGDVSLSWDYFTYSYRNGFGYEYVSAYSLAQVLVYLGAYGVGLVLFHHVYRKIWMVPGAIGIGLCVAGLVSFLIEGSHWILRHNLSVIVSFPIVMVLLWVLVGVKLNSTYRAEGRCEAGANLVEQQTGVG